MVKGVCPMCAYEGDTSEKELSKSHVIPRGVFKTLFSGNSSRLGKKSIVLSSDPAKDLNVSQNQGRTPMLCSQCEGRLSKEVERPALEWARAHIQSELVDADSVLLCRFVSSVWWRAMISNHEFFKDVNFDSNRFLKIMEASLNPEKTLKNTSFRIRRFRDSSGRISHSHMLNAIYTMPDHMRYKGHRSFALIAEGFMWEVFHPRLSRAREVRLGCWQKGRRRYALTDYDFARDPYFLTHAALQLSKKKNDRSSPLFKKFTGKRDGG